MSRKGHQGSMAVDHQCHTLRLTVHMNGHQAPTEDLKALSGGERSYTTGEGEMGDDGGGVVVGRSEWGGGVVVSYEEKSYTTGSGEGEMGVGWGGASGEKEEKQLSC